MQLPIQISFRRMERSPTLEAKILDRAKKLDKFARHIMSCRVVVEPLGRHRLHGNQYEVRIDITLPEGEVVATREPSEHKEYKDIRIAIRDAFDSAARELKEHVRLRRGAVKAHARFPHAHVSKLVPDQDDGLMSTPERREIYFHRNSVSNEAFDRLDIGTEVAFVEEEGDQGPQASTVKRVGRHGGI
jgi:cold shock CspA family protein/ribosome-associated translation inhibitor RaiA